MTDVFAKEKRSEIMSLIRSRNTRLEIDFRRNLWQGPPVPLALRSA